MHGKDLPCFLYCRKGCNMKFSTRSLARAALIAALYALLTFFLSAISFGAIQFRAAEALTLLPILTVDAIPGLFLGCLLANLLGGAVWYDVVFGALATLAAAFVTHRLRRHPLLATAAPVIINGVVVGPIVYMAYMRAPGAPLLWPALLGSAASVALSEAAVCYTLGILLLFSLQKISQKKPDLFKN